MGSDWGTLSLSFSRASPPRYPSSSCSPHFIKNADASSDEDTKKPTAGTPAPPIPAVVPKKGRFADEDASDDDVKDSWDVSDDSDDDDKAKAKKPAVVVGSMRNKGSVKQKIAAREQEEARKAEEAERLVRRVEAQRSLGDRRTKG